MQHKPHNKISTAPRFFINMRGELIDRRADRHHRTGYSIARNHVTRSEMQLLADLLNEPTQTDYIIGSNVDLKWAQLIDEHQRQQRVMSWEERRAA